MIADLVDLGYNIKAWGRLAPIKNSLLARFTSSPRSVVLRGRQLVRVVPRLYGRIAQLARALT